MKIYLELVIFLLFLIIFIIWRLWYSHSTKKLNKNFKPEYDQSRKPGEFYERDKTIGTTESGIDTARSNSFGSKQSERHQLLPKASSNNVGKNISGTGKGTRLTRKFLRRKK